MLQKLTAFSANTSVEQDNIVEKAFVLTFFTAFADDVPIFRTLVLGPAGIPLLIENLKGVQAETVDVTMANVCVALMVVSAFHWCLPALVEQDACPPLIKLLMYVAKTYFFK